jgi:hypothetical protein
VLAGQHTPSEQLSLSLPQHVPSHTLPDAHVDWQLPLTQAVPEPHEVAVRHAPAEHSAAVQLSGAGHWLFSVHERQPLPVQ